MNQALVSWDFPEGTQALVNQVPPTRTNVNSQYYSGLSSLCRRLNLLGLELLQVSPCRPGTAMSRRPGLAFLEVIPCRGLDLLGLEALKVSPCRLRT